MNIAKAIIMTEHKRMGAENRDIQRLYLFHLFNNIAISIVANFLFLDKVFLRMGLSFSSIGVIKGVSYLIPMTLNLLLSPYVLKLNRNREIVAIGYLFRVFLPLILLMIPDHEIKDSQLVIMIAAIMVAIHIFPIIANNSINTIIRSTIPHKVLGKHLTWINVIWTLPGFVIAIPLSKYLDGFAHASDDQFYHAVFLCMVYTGLVQIVSSTIIMFLPNPRPYKVIDTSSVFDRILSPFKDKEFNPLLRAIMVFSISSSMITTFINPYLILVRGLTLTTISLISAIVSFLSIVTMPLWGRSLDTFGGKYTYNIALVGFIVGVVSLLGQGWISLILFASFAWDGQRGCFGSGIIATQQYLVLLTSKPDRGVIYYAAATCMTGIGWFVGSNLGGRILDILQRCCGAELTLDTSYRILFAISTMLAFGLILLINKIPCDRGHLSKRYLRIHLYRSFRGILGRLR